MQKRYVLAAISKTNLREMYLSVPSNGLSMKEMEHFGIHGSTFGPDLSKAIGFDTKKEAMDYYEDQLDRKRLGHLKDFAVMSVAIKTEKKLD